MNELSSSRSLSVAFFLARAFLAPETARGFALLSAPILFLDGLESTGTSKSVTGVWALAALGFFAAGLIASASKLSLRVTSGVRFRGYHQYSDLLRLGAALPLPLSFLTGSSSISKSDAESALVGLGAGAALFFGAGITPASPSLASTLGAAAGRFAFGSTAFVFLAVALLGLKSSAESSSLASDLRVFSVACLRFFDLLLSSPS